MSEHSRERLFPLGQTVITRGVATLVQDNLDLLAEVLHCMGRHEGGDWGEICEEDKRLNDEDVKDGYRLVSVYTLSDGTKIWVITEADRSVTTVLLPDEY